MSGDDHGGSKYQREGSIRLHSAHTGELMIKKAVVPPSAPVQSSAPQLLRYYCVDQVVTLINRQAYVGTTKLSKCFSMPGRFVKEIHFKVKGAPQDRDASLIYIILIKPSEQVFIQCAERPNTKPTPFL
jgi:hypothetical protein